MNARTARTILHAACASYTVARDGRGPLRRGWFVSRAKVRCWLGATAQEAVAALRELRWALADALVKGVAERLGDGFHVDVLDEVVPTWGELPPGGFHVVRRLGLVPGVLFVDWRPVGGRLTRWGNASELATSPVVAIAATADDGTEYVLGVSRTEYVLGVSRT